MNKNFVNFSQLTLPHLGVALLGLSALAVSAQPPSLQLKPCPGFAETGKPPLVYGAQCGQLAVKENPADPQSRDINLEILRLPAISPAAKADPLFLIQGGPGGSSVAMAERIQGFFSELRKNRDLVFVDQRGTGNSNPLNCDALSAEEQLLPEAEQKARFSEIMHACAKKYAEVASFYTTPYAVKDLEQVRTALGYPQINLWGGSYGTRVVLEYMREFPQALRAVVMDGLAPVQVALPSQAAQTARAALAKLNAQCAAQPQCLGQYGDLLENAQTVLRRLNQAEAGGKPLRIAYEHPRTQERKTLPLTKSSFASLVFMSLYSRELSVLLPQVLHQAAEGDYRMLASLSALASEQPTFSEVAQGLHSSVICAEDAKLYGAPDAGKNTFLDLDMTQDAREICAYWPSGEMPADYYQPVVAATPALLLSGAVDPVTPKKFAEAVLQHLSNAQSLEAPGGHHIISIEGCVPQLIAQFIEQASMANINTSCVQKIKPLPLLLGADASGESSSSMATSSAASSSFSSASSKEQQP